MNRIPVSYSCCLSLSCIDLHFPGCRLSCRTLSILQDNKAHSVYSSPVKLLKLAKRIISVPLAPIFKQSICLGIFPSKLKCAKIIPVFKDEDDTLPQNYWPTSLLSIYNRIFEKLMQSRLTTFVKDCNILYDQQYGFCSKQSTHDALCYT